MERIHLVQGDIVQCAVDAIVNAANTGLSAGAGVCGAIHRAAGPELESACRALAPCPPGSARITRGFALPASHVIHAVGPVYRDGRQGEEETLASAYRASLALAAEHDLREIAFPAISTGIYGYPMREAAQVALRTIADWLEHHERPERVQLVLFSASDLAIWEAVAWQ